MATGTVILFKADKGYGFIKPSDNGANIYVHASNLTGVDMDTFVIGTDVQYDVLTEDGKTSAINVTIKSA